MASMPLQGYLEQGARARQQMEQDIANLPGSQPAAPSAPTAPGSSAPPSNAGDESPTPEFPVPPVPPPPSPAASSAPGPGPVFGLAGSGGGGGATSFARPGTAAAAPFRSQYFATNRVTGGPTAARFGAGSAVTAGGSAPFLPAGLGGGGEGEPAADDELQRILAAMRGGGRGR